MRAWPEWRVIGIAKHPVRAVLELHPDVVEAGFAEDLGRPLSAGA